MAKINFMDRDNVLREYELTDEAITMGREATNKVVIADPSVSRQHAWIEKRPDGYYLVDKNSSNGTYVNGKKVTQQKLNHNDKVNLGSASLVFEDEDEGATFILNRQELPDVTRAEEERFNPNERVTDALNADDVGVREDRPLPPPPPRVSPQPAPPPPPAPRPSVQTSAPPIPPPPAAPPAPAPQAAKPDQETPVGILCPSCRKVVEQGARFCPFCGASLGPSKAPALPPPAAAPQKAPPPPVPPQAAPSSARPPIPQPPPVAQPRSPAAPGFGMQPPPPLAVSAGALNYAGFGVRLVAAIIDSLLLSALMIPFIIIVVVFMMRMQTGGEPSPLAMIAVFGSYLLMMIASLAYQLIFIGKKGATPGKKFMKLRVTFPDGTYPIGIGKAFVRLIGYMISGMICYIGFLMIIFDKEQHRALHDKMAGTVVIREN